MAFTRPFNAQRTMKITMRNMRKCVDLSISKVLENVPAAEQNPEVSAEIFRTLITLNNLRTQIDGFQFKNGVSK